MREKRTHKERALDYMRRYGSITSYQAFKDLGNTRLGATIFSLRREGYNIVSDKVKDKNRFGEITYYKRYYLVEE